VSDPSPLLDRAGIEEAFRRLGDRLARRGVVADIYIFGGAAMALAYDSRRVTRDVDALFKPHGIVLEEALAVAAELGLPRWWLNEQASSYVAPDGDSAASRVFDHPGLRVFAASPEHLLAMKALAARPRDAEDIRQLVQVLGLHTVESGALISRSLWVIFIGEWGVWTHATLPVDDRLDMPDRKSITGLCALVGSLMSPPLCHDDEKAMIVLRRPGPAEISEADAYIFRLVRQAAIGRETAPWAFHVVGPDGIREVTEREASQDTAG